ncbi:MAG: glycosyltransferase family 2 protein [Patescibacteria group bacterium]
MANRKVTIIVLTYNSSKYLDECFGTLKKINQGDLAVEIVAVDNASSDGTVEQIRRRWPGIRVVETGSNLGFAGGNNIAMRAAIESGSDYVYLLNHDTEVQTDFLLEAVRIMETSVDIGAVQSLLLLHPEKELVNSAGNAIHFLGFGYCRSYRLPVEKISRTDWPDIAYASGAGVLLRSSALRQVGLFDERLFMYHEDLDLGWRLRLAGYRSVLAPKSVVWHKYEFSRSIGKYYFMERNRYIVLFKNLKLWSLIVLAPSLIMSEFFLSLAAVRGGWWSKKFRALMYFLSPSAWRHIILERERVAGFRKIGDREAMKLFTYEIRDQEGISLFTLWVANPLMNIVWRTIRRFIV